MARDGGREYVDALVDHVDAGLKLLQFCVHHVNVFPEWRYLLFVDHVWIDCTHDQFVQTVRKLRIAFEHVNVFICKYFSDSFHRRVG